MLHKMRWTPQKIAQRIRIIEPLIYKKKHPLSLFRYKTLSGPLESPPIGKDVDDTSWDVIKPKTYWGTWTTDFIMRAQFEVPADWGYDEPIALFLPLGQSGDFSHPESLAFIDGQPYASADRHHHEILLP